MSQLENIRISHHQHFCQFLRKQAEQKLLYRFVRTLILSGFQKCRQSCFIKIRKKIQQKGHFHSFPDQPHSPAADLEHRNSGNSIICQLDLSLGLVKDLSLCHKRNPSLCADACPFGEPISFAFQGNQGRKRGYDLMPKSFCQLIPAAIRPLYGRSPGTGSQDHLIRRITPGFCEYLKSLFLFPDLFYMFPAFNLYFPVSCFHFQQFLDTGSLHAGRIKIAFFVFRVNADLREKADSILERKTLKDLPGQST